MNQSILSMGRPLTAPHWRRWLRRQRFERQAERDNKRKWLRRPVGRGHWRRWRNILAGLYAVLAVAGLHDYITLVSAPGVVGVLALLYTPAFEKHAPGRLRFAWPALFFIAMFFLVPVRTTLYCAWACGACCFLESFHRRVERTVPFVLLLLTPIMGYFVTIFSFPIRLRLTSLAGRIIGFAGVPTAVTGNTIIIRVHANPVDPEMVGHAMTIRDHASLVDTSMMGHAMTVRDHTSLVDISMMGPAMSIRDHASLVNPGSAGHAMTIRDHAFSVDPACIGLHMFVVSLLTALLLMNYCQMQYRRRLGIGPIVAVLGATTVLNVLANLLRIICLVVLNILPSNPLHNILGVVFLLAYILLPLLPVVRWTIRRFGRPVDGTAADASAEAGAAAATIARSAAGSGIGHAAAGTLRTYWRLVANLVIAAAVAGLVLLSFGVEEPHAAALTSRDSVPGYTLKEVNNSILQLDNGRSLVYIKPIPGFYYTDHTPTICWRGSGYEFTNLTDEKVEGKQVYKGVLVKGDQHLYTAWWYDNGIRQTTEAIDWRWDWIHGAPPYSVVNLTAATPEQLDRELHYVLKTRPFRALLGRTAARVRVKIW